MPTSVQIRAGPLEIVTVSPAGEITVHWQLRELEVARRMAAVIAARLSRCGSREVVKIRGVMEVVRTREVAIEIAVTEVRGQKSEVGGKFV